MFCIITNSILLSCLICTSPDWIKHAINKHGQVFKEDPFSLKVTFSTKICHISFVNKNNNSIGRRPREKLTIFKNSNQWEPTQMKNLILYIILIASSSIIYERSSTAPPPYLYRVLLEIHMSLTKPLERPISYSLSHYDGLGPARAWRPRTGLFGKVFSTGLRRVKHGVVRKCENCYKIWGISQNSLYFQFRK